MPNPDDWYGEKNQDRRCFFGLHNYPGWHEDGLEVQICRRCGYMQIPSDLIEREEDNETTQDN